MMSRFILALAILLTAALGQVREDQQAWIRVDAAGCKRFELRVGKDTFLTGPDRDHLTAHNVHISYDASCERIEVVRK